MRLVFHTSRWPTRTRGRADPDAPTKQRHTVQQIFDRPVDEHGADDIVKPLVRTSDR
ncbi:hypothetical protein [Streptomyces sp. NPDC048623]|uniref:hypothetical protein n=1 Tax=Streptomyces sp. NPDC048623 TaxID=3155761 RepID=UPI00342E5A07